MTAVPATSMLQTTLASASYVDAYETGLVDATLTPAEIFLKASLATPRWVETLMSLRNRIVHPLGLKDVGSMRASNQSATQGCAVGDRLGIFTVCATTDNELLLGIDDKHLDVRVSIFKCGCDEAHRYVVSTVVHVHNLLGRIYMFPVGRIHPLVVRSMMHRAAP